MVKKEKLANDNAPSNQLPNSGQRNGGAVQQEEMGAGSGVQQNKEAGAKSALAGVKVSNKPVVVLTQSGLTANGTGRWKANLMTS
jgi:hypothetical protein